MKISSFFSLKEYLSLEIGHRLISRRAGDRYLVSYPRSGNTWMRTMLGVLLNPAAEGNPDFTRKHIPGVSIHNARKINQQETPRMIKSHTWYRPEISKAVYIIRDGRDVMVSLYHYYITRAGKQLPFMDFLDGYLKGGFGPLWHDNVTSWLTRGRERLQEDLLVISFEELKADTRQVLKSAATFLDLPHSDQELDQAIQAANIGRMREIEIERRGPIADQNASFYRGGKTGEWKAYFTPALESVYLQKAGDALHLAGYIG